MSHISDYPGTRSLKLITSIPDQNLTSVDLSDTTVRDALKKNLASFNRMYIVYKYPSYWSSIVKRYIVGGMTAVDFEDATWVRYMGWVYVIGLIWSSEFVLACQHMIISGAVAKWYFTKYVIFCVLKWIFFFIHFIFAAEKIKNQLFSRQCIIWYFIIWVQLHLDLY